MFFKFTRDGYKTYADGKAKIVDWQTVESWEDYPAPNYNAKHTYCRVKIEYLNKTFFYRTRNPGLQVGDRVFVPYGKDNVQLIGTIMTMKSYRGWRVPYPLEKTKFIIGLV